MVLYLLLEFRNSVLSLDQPKLRQQDRFLGTLKASIHDEVPSSRNTVEDEKTDQTSQGNQEGNR